MKLKLPRDFTTQFLFPGLKEASNEMVRQRLTQFYSLGPFKPEVKVGKSTIEIRIDTELIEKQEDRFNAVVNLAERGQMKKALALVDGLLKEAPHISEYHRIKGQLLSDLGNTEEAIDEIIDALRWDPENHWALIMMGNIFARDKDDLETGMRYYERVLELNPDDSLTLNNIGANLMQLQRTEEAREFFIKAEALNPDYPNTQYALGLIAQMAGEEEEAFDRAVKSLKLKGAPPQLRSNAMQLAIESSQELISEDRTSAILNEYVQELRSRSKKEIKIQEDSSIPFSAKLELAENYNRDTHIVRYKQASPVVDHLIMHELVHLEFVLDAREDDENELFITDQGHYRSFMDLQRKEVHKLSKKGFAEESLASYFRSMFEGLNSQVYNTPIDAFIEYYLYDRFKALRPYQFLSLMTMMQEAIKANTDPKVLDVTPKMILSKSKIYNLINAKVLNGLYGVDLEPKLIPSQFEKSKATTLFDEIKDKLQDKLPGEEYDYVHNWAVELQLDPYFDLVDETEYRKDDGSGEELIEKLEKDPYGLMEKDSSKERKMKQFLDAHAGKDINPAVMMYMVGALEYFQKLPQDEVKKISFEIATVGISGIDPKKEGYQVPSINGKTFTGYQLLAYYYVSWSLATPEKVAMLQLPFDKEYQLALKFKDQTDA